jgi:hypothetical protein
MTRRSQRAMPTALNSRCSFIASYMNKDGVENNFIPEAFYKKKQRKLICKQFTDKQKFNHKLK